MGFVQKNPGIFSLEVISALKKKGFACFPSKWNWILKERRNIPLGSMSHVVRNMNPKVSKLWHGQDLSHFWLVSAAGTYLLCVAGNSATDYGNSSSQIDSLSPRKQRFDNRFRYARFDSGCYEMPRSNN